MRQANGTIEALEGAAATVTTQLAAAQQAAVAEAQRLCRSGEARAAADAEALQQLRGQVQSLQQALQDTKADCHAKGARAEAAESRAEALEARLQEEAEKKAVTEAAHKAAQQQVVAKDRELEGCAATQGRSFTGLARSRLYCVWG
jgi:DNA-binding SARP family transcriptional activator